MAKRVPKERNLTAKTEQEYIKLGRMVDVLFSGTENYCLFSFYKGSSRNPDNKRFSVNGHEARTLEELFIILGINGD